MISTYSIKTDLSIANAKWLLNTITGDSPVNYLFAFIGKSTPWAVEDEPPMPVDSIEDYISSWKSLISLKRIPSTEATLAIRRIDWIVNTVYDMYDSKASNLYESNFYVYTSSRRVYKCLSNNNGAPSTLEPASTSLTPFTTLDGYKWQLMYVINESTATKWANDNVIPVAEITSDDSSTQWQVQQAAIPGTIDAIEIVEAGSNYLVPPTITITGDGTGATAEVILSEGSIASITITNRGSGYTYAEVALSGDGGGVLRPIISPIKGHGSNAVEELGARYLIVRAMFDKDENGTFPTDISFRQIGLIMNPTLYGTDTIASDTEGINQMKKLTLSVSPSTFIQGEQLLNQTNNSTCNFVTYEDNDVSINNINGTFSEGDTIIGVSSGITATISDVTNEYLNLYSGRLLYTENRQAVVRTTSQSEVYKLVIAF